MSLLGPPPCWCILLSSPRATELFCSWRVFLKVFIQSLLEDFLLLHQQVFRCHSFSQWLQTCSSDLSSIKTWWVTEGRVLRQLLRLHCKKCWHLRGFLLLFGEVRVFPFTSVTLKVSFVQKESSFLKELKFSCVISVVKLIFFAVWGLSRSSQHFLPPSAEYLTRALLLRVSRCAFTRHQRCALSKPDKVLPPKEVFFLSRKLFFNKKKFWPGLFTKSLQSFYQSLCWRGDGRGRLLHHGKPAALPQRPVRVSLQGSVSLQGPAGVPVYGRWLWDAPVPRGSEHGLARVGSAGPVKLAPRRLAVWHRFTHRLPHASVHGGACGLHQQVRRASVPGLPHQQRRRAVESVRERAQL